MTEHIHTHHARPARSSAIQNKISTSSLSHSPLLHPFALSLYTKLLFLWGFFWFYGPKLIKKTTVHNWYNRYKPYRVCVCVCACVIIQISKPIKTNIQKNMVNRYSHAIVLSYYESRGWITLPPSFQSSFLSQPHSTPPPPVPPLPPKLPPPLPSSHDKEPISCIRYHRPAVINQRGRQPGPVTYPSTPRSSTPPSRAQPPIKSITSTSTTRSPSKSIRHGRSPLRPTPSIITEIFDPGNTSATAACQYAQLSPDQASPILPSPSSQQRTSALTNYDCPSPTSTIFNLLGPDPLFDDDRDYTPPLTNSGSSLSSFHLEAATPFLSESPTDSHDSPILKPFDDFVPTFDEFSQYAAEMGSPWHDPASPTAPTIFSLPTVDLSIQPAMRGRPPPPPPPPLPVEEDEGEDDAIPPPIARHKRPGPAKLTKVDRSAMSFLKQQQAATAAAHLSSSSKRSGGDYSYALGIADPPAIPLNLGSHFSSLRQSPPPPLPRSRQQQQMGIAAGGPVANSDSFEQTHNTVNHHSGLSDWIKGNRSKR